MSHGRPAPEATPRGVRTALGAVLILQFVTSLASGVCFLGPTVDASDVAAVIRDTGAHPTSAYVGIGLDVVTALAVAALGVLFAAALGAPDMRAADGQGRSGAARAVAARVGAALYAVEGCLLLMSKVLAYGFVRGVEASAPESVLAPLLAATKFGYALHMVAFGAGALIFYVLLVRSRLVPAWMSWWGLLSLLPVVAGTLLSLAGVRVPFAVMLPYAPFELVAGLWLVLVARRWGAARRSEFAADGPRNRSA